MLTELSQSAAQVKELTAIILRNVHPEHYKDALKDPQLRQLLVPVHGTYSGKDYRGDSFEYEGELLNGRAHGIGVRKHDWGIYRGQYLEGQRHGYIEEVYGGDRGRCNCVRDKEEGVQRVYCEDGRIIFREYSAGNKHGLEFTLSDDKSIVTVDTYEQGDEKESKEYELIK